MEIRWGSTVRMIKLYLISEYDQTFCVVLFVLRTVQDINYARRIRKRNFLIDKYWIANCIIAKEVLTY